MTSNRYSYTASYAHLDNALRDLWLPFLFLAEEMENFEPEPKENFEHIRMEFIKKHQGLNPKIPKEKILELADKQIEHLSSDRWQFYTKFDRRHMNLYVNVSLLAHALCESLINTVLAIGLSTVSAPDLFTLIENTEFKKKWLYGPKSFEKEYIFPLGSGIHESLVKLSKIRNAIVHHKIELTMGDAKVLDGTDFGRSTYEDEIKWLKRFFSLPYDLNEFIFSSIKTQTMYILHDRKPIKRASEHIS